MQLRAIVGSMMLMAAQNAAERGFRPRPMAEFVGALSLFQALGTVERDRRDAARVFNAGYKQFIEGAHKEAFRLTLKLASDAQKAMREEAPWRDRPSTGGAARRGLYAKALIQGAIAGGVRQYGIEFGYSVGYGFWLETKRYQQGESLYHRDVRAARLVLRAGSDRNTQTGAGEWGRDAIIQPTMGWVMPILRGQLAEIFAPTGGMAERGVAPRVSTTGLASFGGNAAPSRKFEDPFTGTMNETVRAPHAGQPTDVYRSGQIVRNWRSPMRGPLPPPRR